MLQEILSIGFLTAFFSAAVRLAVPLLFASLGEMVSQKAGTLNIGLESVMLSGAFVGFACAYLSGSLIIGFLGGMLGGALFSMLHAFISIYLRQNQSVTGTALNMFALGFTGFFYQIMASASALMPQINTLNTLPLPFLSQIPIIGEAFFNKDSITYLSYVMVILVAIFLNKTVWGMRLISVGENPQAADTVGIHVFRTKYLAALFNGIMSGLGGAYLILGQLGSFTENVTSGRGFIALSIVVFGRRKPLGVFLAALFMGAANALQYRMQALGVALPVQLFTGMPYILTIVVLLISSLSKERGSTEPAALGKPYIRSMR